MCSFEEQMFLVDIYNLNNLQFCICQPFYRSKFRPLISRVFNLVTQNY